MIADPAQHHTGTSLEGFRHRQDSSDASVFAKSYSVIHHDTLASDVSVSDVSLFKACSDDGYVRENMLTQD